MNVRLAQQTFGNRLADAIKLLRVKGYEEMADSEGTELLIRLFNDANDCFNSRSVWSKAKFRCAVTKDSYYEWKTTLDNLCEVIKTMTWKRKSLIPNKKMIF